MCVESVLCFEQCVEFTTKRERFVARYIWWQRWKSGESTMEETVKALETKLAQLEAKFGKKSESGASTSTSSLHIKPESFSATSGESWLAWLRKFKSIAALNKWSPELQCQILPAYLKGLAEQTFYSLTDEQTATWSAVELTDRFHPKESRQVHISTLRAKLRRPDEDLHQLRCEISRLVELAYPEDPPEILNRTARDFFVGSLTPIALREKVLDLGPNTLDEALAAAQRYESNQKVLNKGSTRVLSSTSGEEEGASSASYSAFHTSFGPQQGDQEPPPWAKELFQQQAEMLQKLKNIPQGRRESNVGRQGPRACFKCGSLTHFVRDCPVYINLDQRNLRKGGPARSDPARNSTRCFPELQGKWF